MLQNLTAIIDNVDPLCINFYIENGSLVGLENATPLIENSLASPSLKIVNLKDIVVKCNSLYNTQENFETYNHIIWILLNPSEIEKIMSIQN